jgi:peptidoglycan/LPS O-acetylase OafA/YrhL
MNGVAWYLSVCVFLYAVFPLILNGLKCISSFYKAVVSAILIFTFQCLIGFMLQYTGIQIMCVDNPT